MTPFHLVDNSPWPLVISLTILSTALSFIYILHHKSFLVLFLSLFCLCVVFFLWWRDVVGEATFLRFHTPAVKTNILSRIFWFISSEVIFFFRFFWAIFHSSFSSSVDINILWPPVGVEVLTPYSVPLLNTVILLSSRFTVTWSHYRILLSSLGDRIKRLFFTIFLRLLFTALQRFEYYDSPFLIYSSAYRSCFFIATRFHRFHVIVRTTFLAVCLIRIYERQFTVKSHIRFECAIWYWHFVDVVWIFLYLSLYWWRSF